MLISNNTDTFIENFNQLEDPRIERQKLYPLIEIVFLVVCAKICGAESFREYVRFGQAKITLLQERLPFANGIPSKATLSRVFTLINPELLKGCFIGWMNIYPLWVILYQLMAKPYVVVISQGKALFIWY